MVIENVRTLAERLQWDPTRIRYIPNRRIRTPKAAKNADQLATRLRASAGETLMEDAPNEIELFIMLHTCAYRATRPKRGREIPYGERVDWARRWKIIRDYIVEQNLGLVYSMMARFRSGHADWDELRSEALFAIVRAVEGFNPWRGFRFSTYACNAIARSLIQEARRAGRRRVRFRLGQDLWHEDPERVDSWSELYVDRLQQAMTHNLGELTERESVILSRRFPMDGGEGLTLGEVGTTLGLSKERVRQLQNRALGKLRAVLDADPTLQ